MSGLIGHGSNQIFAVLRACSHAAKPGKRGDSADAMNANSSDHLHTNRGEHFAQGKFEAAGDKQGTFAVEGDYPDVGGNTLYHLERGDGTKLNFTEVMKDADSRKALYHVKWA